jgi:hypothetical protein
VKGLSIAHEGVENAPHDGTEPGHGLQASDRLIVLSVPLELLAQR